MIPCDYQLKSIEIVNGGTVSVTQQDFTYSLVNTNAASGDQCLLLDSSAICGAANPPSAGPTTGAAFLLLRCASNAAGTTPVVCSTTNVYATQVYPATGAGTHAHVVSAGGLINSAITGVGTGVDDFITVGGTNFTGGQMLIGTAYNMDGPNAVTGTDGQIKGIAASQSDYLAGIVYFPSQAGDMLANQTNADLHLVGQAAPRRVTPAARLTSPCRDTLLDARRTPRESAWRPSWAAKRRVGMLGFAFPIARLP